MSPSRERSVMTGLVRECLGRPTLSGPEKFRMSCRTGRISVSSTQATSVSTRRWLQGVECDSFRQVVARLIAISLGLTLCRSTTDGVLVSLSPASRAPSLPCRGVVRRIFRHGSG